MHAHTHTHTKSLLIYFIQLYIKLTNTSGDADASPGVNATLLEGGSAIIVVNVKFVSQVPKIAGIALRTSSLITFKSFEHFSYNEKHLRHSFPLLLTKSLAHSSLPELITSSSKMYLNNGTIFREASVCKFHLPLVLEISCPQPKQRTTMLKYAISVTCKNLIIVM